MKNLLTAISVIALTAGPALAEEPDYGLSIWAESALDGYNMCASAVDKKSAARGLKQGNENATVVLGKFKTLMATRKANDADLNLMNLVQSSLASCFENVDKHGWE